MKNEIEQRRLSSIFWYAISVFKQFKMMTEKERKESARVAGDAIASRSDVLYGMAEIHIPCFGNCSGNKCIAIIAAYCVNGVNTGNLDSEILTVVRAAQEASKNLFH